MPLEVSLCDNPPPGAFARLLGLLRHFNEQRAGDWTAKTLALLLKAPESSEIVGGLWGSTLWGALYIDMLFVPAAQRGTGLGRDLMSRAEVEAARRGCHTVLVDTYDFQARGFYERLGYRVFGTVAGEAPVFPRYFLQKSLSPVAASATPA